MSSVTLRPSLLSQNSSASASSSSSSLVLVSWRSNQYKFCSSFNLPRKSKRFSLRAQCFDSSKDSNGTNNKNNPNGADSKLPNGTLVLHPYRYCLFIFRNSLKVKCTLVLGV